MGGVVSVIASTHPDGDLSANTESPPTRPVDQLHTAAAMCFSIKPRANL